MGFLNKEIESLLATDIFQSIISCDTIKIAQLNALTTFLIKSNIPFVSTFTQGTKADPPSVEVAINLNPSTTLNFTFTFEQ